MRNAVVAHAFGIANVSLVFGVMKRNVCQRMLTLAISGAIFGMWQATHSLPVLPAA